MTNVIPEQYLYFSKVRTSFVLFCQSGEASFLVSHASSAAQHLYFFTSQSSESRRSKLELEDTQLRGLKSQTHYVEQGKVVSLSGEREVYSLSGLDSTLDECFDHWSDNYSLLVEVFKGKTSIDKQKVFIIRWPSEPFSEYCWGMSVDKRRVPVGSWSMVTDSYDL
jgi:hypothetical protein